MSKITDPKTALAALTQLGVAYDGKKRQLVAFSGDTEDKVTLKKNRGAYAVTRGGQTVTLSAELVKKYLNQDLIASASRPNGGVLLSGKSDMPHYTLGAGGPREILGTGGVKIALSRDKDTGRDTITVWGTENDDELRVSVNSDPKTQNPKSIDIFANGTLVNLALPRNFNPESDWSWLNVAGKGGNDNIVVYGDGVEVDGGAGSDNIAVWGNRTLASDGKGSPGFESDNVLVVGDDSQVNVQDAGPVSSEAIRMHQGVRSSYLVAPSSNYVAVIGRNARVLDQSGSLESQKTSNNLFVGSLESGDTSPLSARTSPGDLVNGALIDPNTGILDHENAIAPHDVGSEVQGLMNGHSWYRQFNIKP